jgi:hypothetical protein
MDSFDAGERVSTMWRSLGEQLAALVPTLVIDNDDPVKAIKWATCAEACFWKATGDAATHDVKDVLTPSA